MNILYYDNCWFTNVGEAFIDIGAMELIKRIFPGSRVATISNMSTYYFPSKEKRKIGRTKKNPDLPFRLDQITDYWNYDLLVLAGMFMSDTHLKGKVCEFVKKSSKNGCRIAFVGLGMEPGMSAESIDDYCMYLRQINPLFISTRDKKTFLHLERGGVKRLVCGLDAAFWVKDAFDPRGFSKKLYDVVTFNRSSEPPMFERWTLPIIRPWHMQWHAKFQEFSKEVFISDIPFDYISLYANANEVYTDLVHATIIALQYGRKVKYFQYDNRSDTFLDMEILRTDNEMLYLEETELEKRKEKNIIEIKAWLR